MNYRVILNDEEEALVLSQMLSRAVEGVLAYACGASVVCRQSE